MAHTKRRLCAKGEPRMTFRLTERGQKSAKRALKKFTPEEQERIKKLAEKIHSMIVVSRA